MKWHDTSLPWHRSTVRGEGPSSQAWRRLANEVDVQLLCLFMVADRVDAPGGWRRNAPTTWFLSEAKARGLADDLVLHLDGYPSEICAGAALVKRDDDEPVVLVIRTHSSGWELPKGGIEWDELLEEAALRALREDSGVMGGFDVTGELGRLEYLFGEGNDRRLRQVRYYFARVHGEPTIGDFPERTRQRRWLRAAEVDDVPLVSEDLRMLLRKALEAGAVDG